MHYRTLIDVELPERPEAGAWLVQSGLQRATMTSVWRRPASRTRQSAACCLTGRRHGTKLQRAVAAAVSHFHMPMRNCPSLVVLSCAVLSMTGCAHVARTPASQAVTNRRVVNPPGIAPLVPAYSVAIRSNGQVFVSGMTGIKPGTQDIIEGGVAVQTRQTLENIRTAIVAGGATMADVTECTVFLVDMSEYAAMNAVYVEFFRVEPPARATVAVTALPRPAARVEIKCSAQITRR